MEISKIFFYLKWILAKKTFNFWQWLGFHVTLNNYSEPIPDTRSLNKKIWDTPSDLIGIDMNVDKQLELLTVFQERFKNEYDLFPRSQTNKPSEYYVNNGQFVSVDGEILYCMVRFFKPKNILEIGSGNSTYLSAQAILKNKEIDSFYECNLTAIEPYPNAILKKGFSGLSELKIKKIEDVPLSEFEKLKENDILFIDSSHVMKIGSDVQYELLEILPRLNKGVIVHFHDIFLPSEYLKEWVMTEHRFWNEQYLLQAFLLYNDSFKVLWGGAFMHLMQSNRLKDAFSSYDPFTTRPGSFWIQRIR